MAIAEQDLTRVQTMLPSLKGKSTDELMEVLSRNIQGFSALTLPQRAAISELVSKGSSLQDITEYVQRSGIPTTSQPDNTTTTKSGTTGTTQTSSGGRRSGGTRTSGGRTTDAGSTDGRRTGGTRTSSGSQVGLAEEDLLEALFEDNPNLDRRVQQDVVRILNEQGVDAVRNYLGANDLIGETTNNLFNQTTGGNAGSRGRTEGDRTNTGGRTEGGGTNTGGSNTDGRRTGGTRTSGGANTGGSTEGGETNTDGSTTGGGTTTGSRGGSPPSDRDDTGVSRGTGRGRGDTGGSTEGGGTEGGRRGNGRSRGDNDWYDNLDFGGDPLEALEQIFERQFEYLDNRDETWQQYRDKIEGLLEETPEYAVPEAVNRMANTLEGLANGVRSNYSQASADIKNTLHRGIGNAIDAYTENAQNMVESVKQSGQQGVDAYQRAFEVADRGFNNAIQSAGQNIGEALQTFATGGDNVIDIVNQGTQDYLQTYSQGADRISALGDQAQQDIVGAGQDALTGYQDAAGGIMDIYNRGAESLRNIGQTTTSDYLREQRSARDTLLGDMNDQLRYAQGRANITEMPGQSIYEAERGSRTQANIRQLREMGGGSANTLNAVSQMLSQREQGARQTAMEFANFKSARQKELMDLMGGQAAQRYAANQNVAQSNLQAGQFQAGLEQAATGMQGGAAERTAGNIADLTLQQGQNAAQAAQLNLQAQQAAANMQGGAQQAATGQRAAAQQYATDQLGQAQFQAGQTMAGLYQNQAGALGGFQQGLGQAYFNQGAAMGDAYAGAGQMVGGAQMQGANQMAQGYQNAAGVYNQGAQLAGNLYAQGDMARAAAQDQAWLYNQYQPYMNQANYYQNMARQFDPFAASMGAMGDVAGINLAKYQGQMQADAAEDAAKRNMWGNIFGSLIGGAGSLGAALLASSKDYKYDIEDNVYDSKEIIDNLKVKNYLYKPGYGVEGKDNVGFIAEDAPDIITTPDKKAIDAYSLISLLVDRVQQLSKEVEELKSK